MAKATPTDSVEARDRSLPCIVCGKALKQAITNVTNQPSKGLNFSSHGHYGSTVFDPIIGGAMLEISVCDDCLVKRGKEGYIVHLDYELSTTYKIKQWKGKDDSK